ncbi:hypothetical protein HY498_04745 [Candidatus Woesearchaeota archaeon]|nr:hypothetical protein [Candidatus Woesearchaeota archaeon]
MIYGFTVHNWKNFCPIEDSYSWDDSGGDSGDIIIVADGVTRDPRRMSVIPSLDKKNYKNFFEFYSHWLKFFWKYPGSRLKFWSNEKSPAFIAAKASCESFIYAVKKGSIKTVEYAISHVNETLKYLNVNNSDYLESDFFGSVLAGAALRLEEGQNVLSWGFIADCGVVVFDEKSEMIFRTPNETKQTGAYLKTIENFDWTKPEWRRFVRKSLRNKDVEGGYGVLTGEKSALDFVRFGEIELKPGYRFFLFSDGLEHIIFSDGAEHNKVSGSFIDVVNNENLHSLKGLCERRVRTEGTLVGCSIEDKL